ncbi:RNA-binding protein [Cryobacterium inferilacus]|uniref:RNA-binding protein n=1 Tax=Cryobacterium inferilacus TaxID=2866629 RepID=UPI002106DFB2|nr:RNA-binding protein [Cryobacterium sp. 1639]
MALTFPSDLHAWQRWQNSRNRLRRARDLAQRPSPPSLWLATTGPSPSLLVAVDSTTPSSVAAFAEPLRHLGDAPVAVLSLADISAQLPGEWTVRALDGERDLPRELGAVTTVFAAGHFLPAGVAAHAWARALGARFVVAQHGLLTPWAPPLPEDAHLLAFSDADARYWASGRSDITHEVVGSQLFWRARQRNLRPDLQARPLFLGQLHGAELPRRISARSAGRFCESVGATYRPHPSETDRLSRLQHARWRRRGIDFDTSGRPLSENRRPVVSIFSTGVLEAAAAGIPAWVSAVRPPAWVLDCWERYDMSVWGGDPTPPPDVADLEPAQAIAGSLRRLATGG